jgi:hypothetical protein
MIQHFSSYLLKKSLFFNYLSYVDYLHRRFASKLSFFGHVFEKILKVLFIKIPAVKAACQKICLNPLFKTETEY